MIGKRRIFHSTTRWGKNLFQCVRATGHLQLDAVDTAAGNEIWWMGYWSQGLIRKTSSWLQHILSLRCEDQGGWQEKPGDVLHQASLGKVESVHFYNLIMEGWSVDEPPFLSCMTRARHKSFIDPSGSLKRRPYSCAEDAPETSGKRSAQT